jgi:glycosyltransferase involved in cell wall biosynthesis
MIEIREKPLVTFFVIAYKQEQFVRQAIEGAFAQTYSPLEIILSDDCSPDRTFEIMQEMASHYAGPHKIILNRNEQNRGISGHVNRVMELAKGDLIVAEAGDDLSLPNRVERIFASWNTAGRPVCAISSDILKISADGRPLDVIKVKCSPTETTSMMAVLSGQLPPFIGCSECWDRALFDFFGPLRADVVNEDIAIWFRAELLGCVISVPEILLHYRVHGNNLTNCGLSSKTEVSDWLQTNAELMRRQAAVFRNNLDDIIRFRKAGHGRPDLDDIQRRLHRWLEFSLARRELCRASGVLWWRFAFQCLRLVPAYSCLPLLAKLFLKLMWPNLCFRYRKQKAIG